MRMLFIELKKQNGALRAPNMRNDPVLEKKRSYALPRSHCLTGSLLMALDPAAYRRQAFSGSA
jgi:hypothetical protein